MPLYNNFVGVDIGKFSFVVAVANARLKPLVTGGLDQLA
ncbi:hypothetical protein clem_05840 [Legionella clemsonensis]|uniref:Transposase n=1 Tax=Legionella clemsonensis TaxID=1867846 RepID=A0A222P1K3_9GAMM|nr:hypothetical protein clem_05840 [Legionella clemsonensis]